MSSTQIYKIIAIAAFCFCSTAAPAYYVTFQNAAEFHRMCGNALGAGLINHNLCHGFVQNIAAALANSRRICLPAGTVERTPLIVVQDYMREHPERLGLTAAQIATEALARNYPCRRWR